MAFGELGERNLPIDRLIKKAPATLRRVDGPTILKPSSFRRVYHSATSWFGPPQDAVQAAKELQLESSNVVIDHHTTAGELLKMGIRYPKSFNDYNGEWSRISFGLVNFLSAIRYGTPIVPGYREMGSTPYRFENNAGFWRGDVAKASQQGQLWEYGIIIQGADKKTGFISISNPWDDTSQAWNERLTPKKPFVGREADLDAISLMLTGEKISDQKGGELLKRTSNTETWWTLATMQNEIAGDYPSHMYRSVSDQITESIKPQATTKEGYDLIINATGMWGYLFTAVGSTRRPSTSLSFTDNWLKHIEPIPFTKYERPEEPSKSHLWVKSDKGIYNPRESRSSFSFSINLDQTQDGETPTPNLRVVGRRHPNLTRRFIYEINSPRYGDFYGDSDRFSYSPQARLPLNSSVIRRMIGFFEQAKARAVADSDTFDATKQLTGLTDRTKELLERTEETLAQKLAFYGSLESIQF